MTITHAQRIRKQHSSAMRDYGNDVANRYNERAIDYAEAQRLFARRGKD